MDYIYDAANNSFWGSSQNIMSLGQVMWHITNECRLNCSICFTRNMRKGNDELNLNDIVQYVKCLKDLGVKKIDITGGEPLLYNHLPYLVELCTSNSISLTITTSGAGTSTSLLWLAEHWESFSRVIVSLDGPKSIHNILRRNNCAYAGFERICSLLNSQGCRNLRINTVVTKSICTEACDDLCDIISGVHPLEWCIIEPFPINKTEFFDSLSVDRNTFEIIFAHIIEQLRDSDIKLIRRTNEDYGSYWSLYPDGFLYLSHDNDTYDTKIRLSPENYTTLLDSIKANKQIYINEV